jgi:membrane protein DedA with SNARE-associated domain
MPFGVFLASAIAARSLRFFAVAALLYFFGSSIRNFIERRLGLVFMLFAIILIAGFFAIRLI